MFSPCMTKLTRFAYVLINIYLMTWMEVKNHMIIQLGLQSEL